MKYVISLFTVLCVLLALTSCSTESVDIEVPSTERNYVWETESPGSVGLDSLRIDSAFVLADAAEFVRSILVIKNGKAVAEKYFNFNGPDSWHDLRSATKSFTSAITGIAISKGLLRLSDKIADILPEAIHSEADPRIHNVTIKQILQMKSGIGSDFYFNDLPFTQPTVLEFVMNAPMQDDPGARFIYSSNSNILLNAAIAKVSGKSALEFAEEYLCEPLGISISWWEKDTQGIYFGGGGLFLTTRNMAAFGYLFLNNGNYKGEQIIPASWVRNSFNDELGNSINDNVIDNIGYGYLWWIGSLNGFKVYSAQGYGGQLIMLFPELDMIVATTCEAEVDLNQAYYQGNYMAALIKDYILPQTEIN